MKFKVRVRATGVEREVTPKAYAAMGPKVYEKLGTVNDNGTEIAGQSSPNSKTPQVQRSVRSAEPVVVVKTQLVTPKPAASQPTAAQEPEIEEIDDNQEDADPAPEKRKPGRQPGSKNKKYISSNSDENEQ